MSATDSENATGPKAEWSSAALILVTVATMTVISWQKWADPVLDFGREIYVPWRLYEGDHLYRDVAYQYSPLSPYVNLAWFNLFGVSYRSLVIGNALVFLVLLLLLYRLVRMTASRFATTIGMMAVIVVFAFGQYSPFGNYNYLSPYSHEVTHGLLLSFFMLVVLTRHVETRSPKTLALSGAALGLVFLTKYEVFFAAAGAAIVALSTVWRAERWRSIARDFSQFLASAVVPLLVCTGLLMSAGMSLDASIRGVLGPYHLLLNQDVLALPFYAWSAGLVEPQAALIGGAVWSGMYALSILPVAVTTRVDGFGVTRTKVLAAFCFPIALIFLTTRVDPRYRNLIPHGLSIDPSAYRGGSFLPWKYALVPLPIFLLTHAIFLSRKAINVRAPIGCRAEARASLILTTFSLLLLLKIPLAARVFHYGFALALPGTLLAVVFALDAAPRWLNSKGLNGRLFRAAVLGLLTAFVGIHLRLSLGFFALKTFTLGSGADTLRVDDRGSLVSRAIELVRAHVGPDQTLVVLPQGALINYLTRRRSSVQYPKFVVGEVLLYGEEIMLRELRARPPNYVLSFEHEPYLSPWACSSFGDDCAPAIGAWLRQHYLPRVIGVSQGRRMFALMTPAQDTPSGSGPEIIEVGIIR